MSDEKDRSGKLNPLLHGENELLMEDAKQAQQLNDYFVSVFTK